VTDCLFCRIVARQVPADIEYEDDAVLAFKDIYPKAPVHVLIIPKRHISSIAQVQAEDTDVLGRCVLAARAIGDAKGFGEKGYRLSVNTGPEGGQVVYHVHFHFTAGRQRGPGPGR
jgi:histidine triad (HIT) family protein